MTKHRYQYSSREQEQYFQPIRIKVLVVYRDRRRWDRKTRSYKAVRMAEYARMVLYNVATKEVVAWWSRTKRKGEEIRYGQYRSGWDNSPLEEGEERWHRYGGSKKNILLLAKRTAWDEARPFDLQADVVDEEDFLKGPPDVCAHCGKHPTHNNGKPFVCHECLTLIKIGLARKDSTMPVAIGRYLVRAPSGVDGSLLSGQLRRALVKLTGSALSMKDYSKWDGEFRKAKATVGTETDQYYSIADLAQEDVETLNTVLKLIQEGLWSAYNQGVRHGSSILQRIAEGELPQSKIDEIHAMQKREFEE